jgi:hypothetical protein
VKLGSGTTARVLVVVPVLAALALCGQARATTWVVNDTSGAATVPPANGACDAPGSAQCTLAEAVLEANAAGHTDTIHFNLAPGSTITLASTLTLSLNQPMTIDGCSGAISPPAPCVGIHSTTDAFIIGAGGIAIRGLAMGGASPEAIFAPCCLPGLTVTNDWFGLALSGSDDPGGAGLDLRTNGATIGGSAPSDRNVFAGGAVGIRIIGGSGIRIAGNYFGVRADGVTPDPLNFEAIKIESNGLIPATANLIGGDTPAAENLISNSAQVGGAPIHIVDGGNLGVDGNTWARNHGSGNARPFIDLDPLLGPGTDLSGPNAGIQPPSMTGSPGSLSGSATPGATIRVYRTDAPSGTNPLNLLRFVGRVAADGAGAWSLACPSSACAAEPASGDSVTANQTDPSGNSSELAHAAPYTRAPVDTTPPKARITKGPRKTRKRRVKFRFTSNEAGSRFQCRLDRKPFRGCRSPKAFKVKPGKHTFKVRAIDAVGNVGSPVKRRFRVLP